MPLLPQLMFLSRFARGKTYHVTYGDTSRRLCRHIMLPKGALHVAVGNKQEEPPLVRSPLSTPSKFTPLVARTVHTVAAYLKHKWHCPPTTLSDLHPRSAKAETGY